MRSDTVRKGTQQAPHRSLFNALGMTKEEMDKPLVGIVSSYNEIVPGHMNLDKIVNAVKLGVAMAGGTPVVFPAIAVCDGIAEAMALAHQFDALVMVPNCDKNVPGLLMAAARINVPTVFVSGGPMLAGHVKGHKTSLSSMFEAVGSYAAGTITADDLEEFENKTCPTCGSCSGMYTANSMNCLTEVLGMGLKGNGTIPAVYSERIRLAKHAGMQVMEMYRRNIRPRDIMTKEAVLNALTVDMALGCSTNSMLHLPAIAHEIGMDFDISFANEISEKTPNLCHLAPAGPTYMEDLNEAGGVYAVMNEPNSTMQRLIRKLNLLDAIDEQSGSGKLNLIIQLPYVIKTEARRQQAEKRRKDIEDQLSGSKYGVAYTDGTERVVQLNRPIDNNLMTQIEYLTSMLFSQLGLTQAILDGSADDKTMLNYYSRMIEPILAAIVDAIKRTFLTKTARSQKQSIMFFRDPFTLVPVNDIAEIADKFTRNEIMTSNEIRQKIGMMPSKDPKADELRNSNLSAPSEETAPTLKEEKVQNEAEV